MVLLRQLTDEELLHCFDFQNAAKLQKGNILKGYVNIFDIYYKLHQQSCRLVATPHMHYPERTNVFFGFQN